jgi:hypothetical protein
MVRPFFGLSIKLASAFSVLVACAVFMTGCDNNKKDTQPTVENNSVPISNLPPGPFGGPGLIGGIGGGWDIIKLMVRTDPLDPQNERFLDDWRFRAFNIDDDGRELSTPFFGAPDAGGNAALGLPGYMFELPLVIQVYNEAFPLIDDIRDNESDSLADQECTFYEIFIPPRCYNQAIWVVGPVEDAVWQYYRHAAERKAEAWNPSQVDCATWLGSLAGLIGTDIVEDALEGLSDLDEKIFTQADLFQTFQENQQFLVPTRPPICMAEKRHNGGGMDRGNPLVLGSPDPDIGGDFPRTLDDNNVADLVLTDSDPVTIGGNGIVNSICGVPFDGTLVVNGGTFTPTRAFELDEPDFLGTIHEQDGPPVDMEVVTYNVRMGNGRELDSEIYDDACSVTTAVEFINNKDIEADVKLDSGVTFVDLFDTAVADVQVHLTSSGDAVVGPEDTWAILVDANDPDGFERVISVTLLGHREEDYEDRLQMELTGDDLFLGLESDFELNEENRDGRRAFITFTITTWDGSSEAGRLAVRRNIANCYEAADPWARQYLIPQDFQDVANDCCIDDDCEITDLISPLLAAEFAERSQCFSNSRANQRWQTDEVGYWSINNTHGVASNVIINPGWLAPDLDFEIYVQNYDEAVFKGPVTVRHSDESGQLLAELPMLTEGDRVLIKAEDNCCSDFDLAIPCVPEFTGFVGLPGVPYVKTLLAPVAPVVPGLPLGPLGPVGPGGPLGPIAKAPGAPAKK